MQTVILGSSGNDTIEWDAASSGNGALVLTLGGTIAQGQRPVFDVLVNGVVVRSDVQLTVDMHQGTQQVYVPMPAGTIDSVTIDYKNDEQTSYASEDRNIYISSVSLNGTNLPTTSALYTRDGYTGPFDAEDGHVITGRPDMNWGGEMTWSGSLVQNATAGGADGVLIDGGAGLDTVHFDGARSDFTLNHSPLGAFSVTPIAGGASTSFGSVERLDFSGSTHVAIDFAGTGGLAALMISALLGSQYVTNTTIAGQALHYLDQGMDPTTLMEVAATTDFFVSQAGSTSNTDFVRYVYHNLAGFNPSQTDLDLYVGMLDRGEASKGQLAMGAAMLDINVQHVIATGVPEQGMEYLPFA